MGVKVSIAFPTPVDAPDWFVNAVFAFLGGGAPVSTGGMPIIQPDEPPTAITVPQPISLPSNTDPSLGGAATAILEGIGAAVNSTTQAMVEAWIRSEKPAGQPLQWNNPLNTTLSTDDALGSVNSAGVKSYATLDGGIAANVQTLQGSYQRKIADALRGGDVDTFLHALNTPPCWGSSPTLVASILGVGFHEKVVCGGT